MVTGDGHERSEVYVYFIRLQVIVLAVLHHLRVDAAGIVGYHLGGRYYRDAICRFLFLFFRPEKHFSIVYSTYEDILVCGKSMQGGLDFGVFGVGIVVHIRVTVPHQENDVLLFGQFALVVVVKNLCHFVRIIIGREQVGAFQHIDVRIPVNHKVFLDIGIHQREVFLAGNDVKRLYGYACISCIADGFQPLVQFVARFAGRSLCTADAGT